MIKCLGRAYRGLYPDCESDKELEEGLENCQENKGVDSKALQEHMAIQAQITACNPKGKKVD
jgi:hypothetical protein